MSADAGISIIPVEQNHTYEKLVTATGLLRLLLEDVDRGGSLDALEEEIRKGEAKESIGNVLAIFDAIKTKVPELGESSLDTGESEGGLSMILTYLRILEDEDKLSLAAAEEQELLTAIGDLLTAVSRSKSLPQDTTIENEVAEVQLTELTDETGRKRARYIITNMRHGEPAAIYVVGEDGGDRQTAEYIKTIETGADSEITASGALYVAHHVLHDSFADKHRRGDVRTYDQENIKTYKYERQPAEESGLSLKAAAVPTIDMARDATASATRKGLFFEAEREATANAPANTFKHRGFDDRVEEQYTEGSTKVRKGKTATLVYEGADSLDTIIDVTLRVGGKVVTPGEYLLDGLKTGNTVRIEGGAIAGIESKADVLRKAYVEGVKRWRAEHEEAFVALAKKYFSTHKQAARICFGTDVVIPVDVAKIRHESQVPEILGRYLLRKVLRTEHIKLEGQLAWKGCRLEQGYAAEQEVPLYLAEADPKGGGQEVPPTVVDVPRKKEAAGGGRRGADEEGSELYSRRSSTGGGGWRGTVGSRAGRGGADALRDTAGPGGEPVLGARLE